MRRTSTPNPGTGPDPGTKSKPGEDEPARFEVSRTSHPLAGPTYIREAGVIVRHALTNMLSLVEPGYTQDLKIAALARSVARDLQYSKSRADEDDEGQRAIEEQQRQQQLADIEADKKRKKKEAAAKKAEEGE